MRLREPVFIDPDAQEDDEPELTVYEMVESLVEQQRTTNRRLREMSHQLAILSPGVTVVGKAG